MRRSEMIDILANVYKDMWQGNPEISVEEIVECLLRASERAGMLPPTIGRPGVEVDEYGPFDFINEWESEANHVNDATGYIADEV